MHISIFGVSIHVLQVNKHYVSSKSKFSMLIIKLEICYLYSTQLADKWVYHKSGKFKYILVSSGPFELSTDMWGSMTVLQFHEDFTFYTDLVLRYEDGFLRNFSEFFDFLNFYVAENIVLDILGFST